MASTNANKPKPRARSARSARDKSRPDAKSSSLGRGDEILIVGSGKVGSALASASKRAGVPVRLIRARGVWRGSVDGVTLIILAVRDPFLAEIAARLIAANMIRPGVAVVHCSGALGPEPLATLRPEGAHVAQMHPMISFASPRKPPSLAKGQVHVLGDRLAVQRARAFARRLGMIPRTLPEMNLTLYHAAAGLVANGAVALAAAGVRVLEHAGVDEITSARMLGPLLRSVAENIEILRFPDALTGPVRRGETASIARHLEMLRGVGDEIAALYRALARAQLPLARQLGEAAPADFDALERMVDG